MPLVQQDGKLVVSDGQLSVGGEECCCPQCDICVSALFPGPDDNIVVLPLCANCCHGDEAANQYGQKTITVPPECPQPVWITITGSIDDELVINGAVVQQNMFPGPAPPNGCYNDGNGGQDCSACNGAHEVNYSFEYEGASFDLAVGDNHGSNVYYDLTICFYSSPP